MSRRQVTVFVACVYLAFAVLIAGAKLRRVLADVYEVQSKVDEVDDKVDSLQSDVSDVDTRVDVLEERR